jgi:hypothetical protein
MHWVRRAVQRWLQGQRQRTVEWVEREVQRSVSRPVKSCRYLSVDNRPQTWDPGRRVALTAEVQAGKVPAQAEAEPPTSEWPLMTWPTGSSSGVAVEELAGQPSIVRAPRGSVACAAAPEADQVARPHHGPPVIPSASHPHLSLQDKAEPQQREAQEAPRPMGTPAVLLATVEVEAALVAGAVAAGTSVAAEELQAPSAPEDRPKLDLAEAGRGSSQAVAPALPVKPESTLAMAL